MAAMPSCHNVSRRGFLGAASVAARAVSRCAAAAGRRKQRSDLKFWTCPMPPDGRTETPVGTLDGVVAVLRTIHVARQLGDAVTLFLPLVTWLVDGEGHAIATEATMPFPSCRTGVGGEIVFQDAS